MLFCLNELWCPCGELAPYISSKKYMYLVAMFVFLHVLDDTGYGLSALYSLGFRGVFFLIKLFPTISFNKCHPSAILDLF